MKNPKKSHVQHMQIFNKISILVDDIESKASVFVNISTKSLITRFQLPMTNMHHLIQIESLGNLASLPLNCLTHSHTAQHNDSIDCCALTHKLTDRTLAILLLFFILYYYYCYCGAALCYFAELIGTSNFIRNFNIHLTKKK